MATIQPYRSPIHFNPRSREGSDAMALIEYGGAMLISIHAPAKGATALRDTYTAKGNISIHAPAKGATTLI